MEPFIIAFFAIWVVVLFIKSQERCPEDPPPPYDWEPPHWREYEDPLDWEERDRYLEELRRDRYARRARRLRRGRRRF